MKVNSDDVAIAMFAADVSAQLNSIEKSHTEIPKSAGKINRLDPRDILSKEGIEQLIPVPIPKSANDLIPGAISDRPLPIPMEITSQPAPVISPENKQQLELEFMENGIIKTETFNNLQEFGKIILNRLEKFENMIIIQSGILREVRKNTTKKRKDKYELESNSRSN